MTIERIDQDLCTGCGECVASCPNDVIRLDPEQGQAVIRYPDDCTLCGWCAADCPEDAIYLSPEKSTPPAMSWG
jgi:NAD-dependent dihydropyrimidine dehydrogenase PreA subunit